MRGVRLCAHGQAHSRGELVTVAELLGPPKRT